MEVWDDDVLALSGKDTAAVASLLVDAGAEVPQMAERPQPHRGKYRQLSAWLAAQDGDEVRATFREIEEAMGLPLPASSRNHVPHWHGYNGSAVARAIIDAGWRARDVNLTAETVRFERNPTAAASKE